MSCVDMRGLTPETRKVGGKYCPVVVNALVEVWEGGQSHDEGCGRVQHAVRAAPTEVEKGLDLLD